MRDTRPKLSIFCITYNQAPFIRQALDGFVMQKTNFPFVAIVGDDCSTDGTTEIIREYAERYPDIIKPIYHDENTKGWGNGCDVSAACQSEYVAMCEGDDYWTDEYKLQKQVDFLDAHPDFTICFHPVVVKWEERSKKDSIFPKKKDRFYKTELELADLAKRNFIQTNAVVYRWQLNATRQLKDIWPEGIAPGDWYLHLFHAEKGKIGFLSDVMAVYRKHAGGLWSGAGKSNKWFLSLGIPHVRFFEVVEKHFKVPENPNKYQILKKLVLTALQEKRLDILQQVYDEFPHLMKNLLPEFDAMKQISKLEKRYKKAKKICKAFIGALLILLLWCVLIQIRG